MADLKEIQEEIMMTNEAIARGVIEAGVKVAAGYPGTPSSEIIDTLAPLAAKAGMHVEWSVNEKVAFEVAAGAAFLGVRSFCAMKSVGLNVAMDPFMVTNLAGVTGGFVFVCADDPNCWSTQNEQDSRLFARLAEIPCLEPSSAQEAKEMVKEAYEISEKFEIPVLMRTVTRLNHGRGRVTLGEIFSEKREPKFYRQRAGFHAVPKHKRLHEKYPIMRDFLEKSRFNRLEICPDAKTGIITSGNAYNYVKEAVSLLDLEGKINLLKVATLNPPPDGLLKQILEKSDTVLVIEEIEPYLESHARTLVYELNRKPNIIGKLSGHIPFVGEVDVDSTIELLSKVLNIDLPDELKSQPEITLESFKKEVPSRNFVFCPGCPHTASFHEIREALQSVSKVRGLIAGDVGCYGLGCFAPYELFDTHICMGASIGIANGLSASQYKDPVVSIIGDSTFFHSGMPALVNAVFNRNNLTVFILDNFIIAMTGHQPDPLTGHTAMGQETKKLVIEDVCRALGVEDVRVVDPFQIDAAIDSIKGAIQHDGVSVVIMRGDCAIMSAKKKKTKKVPLWVDPDECVGCRKCVDGLFCGCIIFENDKSSIDETLCVGCNVCAQLCPTEAIKVKGEKS